MWDCLIHSHLVLVKKKKKVWCFWTGTISAWLFWSDVSCNPHRLMACQLIDNTFSVLSTHMFILHKWTVFLCTLVHYELCGAGCLCKCVSINTETMRCENKYSTSVSQVHKNTKRLSQRAGASLSSQVLCVHNQQLRWGLQICSC